jgi:hypothetical protein
MGNQLHAGDPCAGTRSHVSTRTLPEQSGEQSATARFPDMHET